MGFQRTAGLFFGVAWFCTIPFSLIWFGLRGDRAKAYALIDQRLLMIVGPRREDVCMAALTALAPVEVKRQPKHDKMVQFSLKDAGLLRYARPIWTLESGRVDAWRDSSRYADNPDAVSEELGQRDQHYAASPHLYPMADRWIMGQHRQQVQDLEADRRYRAEIEGHQFFHVVLEESTPRLGGRLIVAHFSQA